MKTGKGMKGIAWVLAGGILVLSGVALQLADARPAEAANTVSVTVTASQKITLTMADATLDFGNLDPGTTTTAPTAVTANVRSNKAWDLTYTASGMNEAAGMPLSQLKWGTEADGSGATSFAATGTFLSNQPKAPSSAGQDVTHYYTIEVPWSADPGAYSATVTYSATFHP